MSEAFEGDVMRTISFQHIRKNILSLHFYCCVALAIVSLFTPVPPRHAHAQTCVAQGDGTTWGSCDTGGGYAAPRRVYVAPAPPPPSPHQLGHAYNEQAVAASRRGDYETAVKLLRIAAGYDPSDAQIQKNLRLSLAGMLNKQAIALADGAKNYGKAISVYEQALRYDPANSYIKRNLMFARANLENQLGTEAINNDEWEEAIEHLKKSESIVGSNDVVEGNLDIARAGKLYSEARAAVTRAEYDSAVEKFRQAMASLDGAIKSFRTRHDPATKLSLEHALASHDTIQSQMENALERKGADQDRSAIAKSQALPPVQGEASTPLSFSEGGALGQAKAADQFGRLGASQNGKELMTRPGGPNEDASDLAGTAFDRGVKVPASSGPVFGGASGSGNQAPQSQFSEQMVAKLRATPVGQQLLAKEVQLRSDLQQVQTTIAKLRGEPNAASNPNYAKALIAQDQLYGKLNTLPQEAEKITRVVLDPAGTSDATKEPPSPSTPGRSSGVN